MTRSRSARGEHAVVRAWYQSDPSDPADILDDDHRLNPTDLSELIAICKEAGLYGEVVGDLSHVEDIEEHVSVVREKYHQYAKNIIGDFAPQYYRVWALSNPMGTYRRPGVFAVLEPLFIIFGTGFLITQRRNPDTGELIRNDKGEGKYECKYRK